MSPHPPMRLRIIWRVMKWAEQLAQWCRFKWVRWHDNKGAILPGDDDKTPPERGP
jgi:hypothetical protein